MIEWIITLWAHLFHPRSVKLNREQAEYVQSLFLGGADPAEMGRAMDKRYGRKSWKAFQSWDGESFRFVWPDTVAYDMDGLEYLRSAMIKLKACRKRGNDDIYDTSHPMVQKIGEIAKVAPIPEKREA